MRSAVTTKYLSATPDWASINATESASAFSFFSRALRSAFVSFLGIPVTCSIVWANASPQAIARSIAIIKTLILFINVKIIS